MVSGSNYYPSITQTTLKGWRMEGGGDAKTVPIHPSKGYIKIFYIKSSGRQQRSGGVDNRIWRITFPEGLASSFSFQFWTQVKESSWRIFLYYFKACSFLFGGKAGQGGEISSLFPFFFFIFYANRWFVGFKGTLLYYSVDSLREYSINLTTTTRVYLLALFTQTFN